MFRHLYYSTIKAIKHTAYNISFSPFQCSQQTIHYLTGGPLLQRAFLLPSQQNKIKAAINAALIIKTLYKIQFLMQALYPSKTSSVQWLH